MAQGDSVKKKPTAPIPLFVNFAKKFSEVHDRDARDLRLIRLLTTLNIVFFGIVLAQLAAIMALTPLKTAVPYLVTIGKYADIYTHITPLEVTSSQEELLVENFIRQVVILRNEVFPEPKEMARRWRRNSQLGSAMTREIFEKFVEGARPSYEQLKINPFRRTVEITNIIRRENLVDVWFKTKETLLSDEKAGLDRPLERCWRAFMAMSIRKPPEDRESLLLNPLNIVIDLYNQEEEERKC